MKIIELPSVEYLNEIFEYDFDNGKLYWKKSGKGIKKSKLSVGAGYINKHDGYVSISVNGTEYKAHRLIWKMFYGYDPKEVDHINGNRSDNRIENLREVTRSQNSMNQHGVRKNSSGVRGVGWDKFTSKWRVRITKEGKVERLGRYKNLEDAIQVRKDAEIRLFKEYAPQ